MKSSVFPALWPALACSLLVTPALAAGQTITSATVTGIVRDTSEAVVPEGRVLEAQEFLADDARLQTAHRKLLTV